MATSVFHSATNRVLWKGRKAPDPQVLAHQYLLSNHRNASRKRMMSLMAPPPSWDSRTHNWVGPVKDQSQCGSCWDFSGTGVVEIAMYMAGVLKPDGSQALSEQYTLSCYNNGGCNGDDNTTVLDHAKSTGLPLSSEYGSYQASAGSCNFKQGMKLYKVDDWGFCGNQQGVASDDSIKQAIMAHGSVGAAIAADDAFSNVQPGQVFNRTTSTGIDHDIILCGWDDSKGQNGKTAWLLRNSWGTSWCDGGYCWILSGVNLVGTEAVYAVVQSVAPVIIDWTP